MMSIYPYFSDYSKQAAQFRREQSQSLDYNPHALQWLSTESMNQNKHENARGIEDVASYPADIKAKEQFDREEMLSWYQTVPLRHDSCQQDFETNERFQELQISRKEHLLTRQKRFRTSFTTCQLGRLEEEFQKDKYAVGMKRLRLARELGLTEKQIKVWYQNRRMKYKRVCQRIHNKRMMATVNSYW